MIMEDRLSELPNEILSVILSFLPLKEAAATSVLSSRWSDSWKHTPNLDFDRDIVPDYNRMADADVLKYMEIVNSILHSHKTLSLKQFRINIRFLEKSAKRRAVTKWLGKCLEFVFLRKVESLELYCWMDGDDKVVLGESLREMKTMHGNPPRSLIFFQSLKSLELAYLEVSGEDVGMFLRNCPLLEKLMIRNVSLTSDIEVCGPSLKHLVIHGVRGGKSIKVSAPNLTYINFDDQVGKLLFENVPRLVVANFTIRTSEFIKDHFASAASSRISQLQFLYIYYVDSKVFWKNAFPQMPNLKKLAVTLTNAAYDHSLLPVTRLIWASPRLEEFTLLFNSFREEPSAYMQEIENAGRSPHQHLKVFHLYLFYSPYRQRVNDHMVELVNYVSNNCVALRRIDIVCSKDSAPGLLQTQLPNHVQLSVTPA